jgi:hypothetical protein
MQCQDAESAGVDHPTIYVDGVGWDITDLLTPSSSRPVSSRANAINNAGQIAASAGLHASASVSALLITCTRL